MNVDYLMPEAETPLTISQFGLYDKYTREATRLYRQLAQMSDQFIESAFDLYNERLMENGEIPDINDIICTIHADEIIEVHGTCCIH